MVDRRRISRDFFEAPLDISEKKRYSNLSNTDPKIKRDEDNYSPNASSSDEEDDSGFKLKFSKSTGLLVVDTGEDNDSQSVSNDLKRKTAEEIADIHGSESVENSSPSSSNTDTVDYSPNSVDTVQNLNKNNNGTTPIKKGLGPSMSTISFMTARSVSVDSTNEVLSPAKSSSSPSLKDTVKYMKHNTNGNTSNVSITLSSVSTLSPSSREQSKARLGLDLVDDVEGDDSTLPIDLNDVNLLELIRTPKPKSATFDDQLAALNSQLDEQAAQYDGKDEGLRQIGENDEFESDTEAEISAILKPSPLFPKKTKSKSRPQSTATTTSTKDRAEESVKTMHERNQDNPNIDHGYSSYPISELMSPQHSDDGNLVSITSEQAPTIVNRSRQGTLESNQTTASNTTVFSSDTGVGRRASISTVSNQPPIGARREGRSMSIISTGYAQRRPSNISFILSPLSDEEEQYQSQSQSQSRSQSQSQSDSSSRPISFRTDERGRLEASALAGQRNRQNNNNNNNNNRKRAHRKPKESLTFADLAVTTPDLTIYEPAVPASLKCPICTGILKEPVLSPCGHTYCSTCIESEIEKQRENGKEPYCPLDSEPIEDGDLFPNASVEPLLRDITIRCKFGCKKIGENDIVADDEGCMAIIPLAGREKHESKCPYAWAACPYSPDCPLIRRKELVAHKVKCERVLCLNSEAGCAFTGTKDQLDEHLEDCVYGPFKDMLNQSYDEVTAVHQRLADKEEEVSQLVQLVQTLSADVKSLNSQVADLSSGIPVNQANRRKGKGKGKVGIGMDSIAEEEEEGEVDDDSDKVKGKGKGKSLHSPTNWTEEEVQAIKDHEAALKEEAAISKGDEHFNSISNREMMDSALKKFQRGSTSNVSGNDSLAMKPILASWKKWTPVLQVIDKSPGSMKGSFKQKGSCYVNPQPVRSRYIINPITKVCSIQLELSITPTFSWLRTGQLLEVRLNLPETAVYSVVGRGSIIVPDAVGMVKDLGTLRKRRTKKDYASTKASVRASGSNVMSQAKLATSLGFSISQTILSRPHTLRVASVDSNEIIIVFRCHDYEKDDMLDYDGMKRLEDELGDIELPSTLLVNADFEVL